MRWETDETTIVDKEFQVRGVQGLRVVDLLVAPMLQNNYTQSTAYLIGEMGVKRVVVEYGL
jgi:hypothetical protein